MPSPQLVCEIVDDMLLGEGILTTVADARRRLLSPRACIIPCAAAIWALAVEMRPPEHAGFQLHAFQSFHCDLPMTPEPIANAKLQHMVEGVDYRVLAKPIKLFSFDDWATRPAETICEERTSPPLPLDITHDGVMSAVLIYFSISLDGEADHGYGSGPAFAGSHWEQNCRWLPHERRVRRGQRLRLLARHSDHHVGMVRLVDVTGEMLRPGPCGGRTCTPEGHERLVGLPQMQGAASALDWAL